MSELRIIGIDPGLATGVVSMYIEDDKIAAAFNYEYDANTLGNYLELCLDEAVPTVVAVETFVIGAMTIKNSPAPWSLEVIGMIRYLTDKWRAQELRMVKQGDHKGLITDDRLKRAGLYFPGQDHARDAARIAVWTAISDYNLLKWTLRKER